MGREQLPAEPAGWCLSLRCLIPDTGNDLPWALVAVTRRFPLVVTVAWTVRPIYTLGTPELSERGSDHPGLQSGAGLPAPPHTAVLWFWTSVSPACPRSAPPQIPPPWVPGSCARSESGERRTLAAASGMPGAGLPSSGAGPPGRPEPVWPRDPDQPVAVHPKRSGSPRARNPTAAPCVSVGGRTRRWPRAPYAAVWDPEVRAQCRVRGPPAPREHVALGTSEVACWGPSSCRGLGSARLG